MGMAGDAQKPDIERDDRPARCPGCGALEISEILLTRVSRVYRCDVCRTLYVEWSEQNRDPSD
jgi:hypothetical protein